MSHSDSLFDQMAASPEYFHQVVDKPLQITTTIHDTQTIMDVYMSRPKAITYMSLGLWFSKAHCLKQRFAQWKELEDFGLFTILCKRFMVLHRLTELPLEPLEAYNKAWKDKETGIGAKK